MAVKTIDRNALAHAWPLPASGLLLLSLVPDRFSSDCSHLSAIDVYLISLHATRRIYNIDRTMRPAPFDLT